MEAPIIAAAAVQVLLEKTISLAAERFGYVLGFKNDLQELQKYASKIKAVLADAEGQQTESQQVRLWLKEVEKVAFEADNVLDELSYESLRREVKSRNRSNGGKVCLFFSLSKHDISFRWRMGSKVRDINTKLKSFNLEANQIGLKILAAALRPTTEAGISRETNSLVPKFVVGRAKEESEIVDKLLGYSGQNVFVLPIVGMGGLGKTTLAKSVYHNQQFDGHFTKKGWICVSDEFEVTKVLGAILGSLKRGKIETSSQDVIVEGIKEELDGQKFLLVLDDVWNKNSDLWTSFFDSLEELNNTSGSCCLLTTRLQTTADMVSRAGGIYPLKKLSDDDCWSILTQRATLGGRMPQVLDDYKGEILSKCQGLPLAAKVIGDLLNQKKRGDWLSFVTDMILKVSGDNKDGIMPILKLSFDNLPSPFIKKCFAYCSIFPKDTILREDELIELWMAEGFLQANLERRTIMEEIGGNYFRILMQSSLLEEGDYEGEYQMHDLVHDLATMVSRAERLNVNEKVVMEEINHDQVRYLAIDSVGERTEKILKTMSPSLVRTLFVNTKISSVEMLSKLEYLHVLNLSGRIIIEDLPNSISILKHLRYLNLSYSKIKRLPESLCKLYHLQTLRLIWCRDLEGLPQGMNNLISLRHLHISDIYGYKFQMPLEMGRLTCLQTLEFFNIGEEKGCGIEELGPMGKLKGRLRISNLELVKGKEGAKQANLFGKQNLIDLVFLWGSTDRDGDYDDQVLEGLQPQPNLQRFTIKNFMGTQFPKWLGNLASLVELNLEDCESCTELPAMGHLPCLEHLIVWGLHKVRSIGASFYGIEECDGGGQVLVSRRKVFPALKSFVLFGMTSLVEWKEVESTVGDDAVVFPKLERLCIEDCDQLAIAPTHFSSLKQLEIRGDVQVLAVKNILNNIGGTLKTLSIYNMDGLTCLSDVVELQHNDIFNKCLISLERLEIEYCKNLISIPSETIMGSTSLEVIFVWCCPNFKSFPLDLKYTPSLSTIVLFRCLKFFTSNEMPKGFGHLTNLRKLAVGPFSDDSFDMFNWSEVVCCSSTLKDLSLSGKHQVQTQLPNQIQHFTSLTELTIEDYPSLETLPEWLGNLVSLKNLHVEYCPKLKYLPSMHSMRGLIKLKTLKFVNCPLLEERYNSESGPDSEWFKISLLPNIEIAFFS